LRIRVFYDKENFRLKGVRGIVKIINKVIKNEKKVPGELNFIFSDDITLKSINIKFLKRNFFTDVIAFDNSIDDKVCGEIYISIDRVKVNAKKYNVSFQNEVLRVILHGLLHICGYSDDEEEERELMKRKEDKWILEYFKNI
jgi:probable rRNA maturation factor